MFRCEYGRVLRWCLRRGVPESDVDDVVQEVFLIAHRRAGEEVARPWLYQVTRGVCANYRRGRARAQARSHGLDWTPPLEQPPSQPAVLEGKRKAQQFAAFLDTLPPAQREAFELFVLDGFDGHAIAEATQTPRNTVYTRINRAKAQFHLWLAEQGGSDDE